MNNSLYNLQTSHGRAQAYAHSAQGATLVNQLEQFFADNMSTELEECLVNLKHALTTEHSLLNNNEPKNLLGLVEERQGFLDRFQGYLDQLKEAIQGLE